MYAYTQDEIDSLKAKVRRIQDKLEKLKEGNTCNQCKLLGRQNSKRSICYCKRKKYFFEDREVICFSDINRPNDCWYFEPSTSVL